MVQSTRETTYDQDPGGSIQCSIDGVIHIDDRDFSGVPSSGADAALSERATRLARHPNGRRIVCSNIDRYD